jgi:hypothetical protein
MKNQIIVKIPGNYFIDYWYYDIHKCPLGMALLHMGYKEVWVGGWSVDFKSLFDGISETYSIDNGSELHYHCINRIKKGLKVVLTKY